MGAWRDALDGLDVATGLGFLVDEVEECQSSRLEAKFLFLLVTEKGWKGEI